MSSLYGFSAAFTAAADTCFAHVRLVGLEDTAVLRLFALQNALTAMCAAWGVVLTVLAGHNFGEYAALVCAGVLDLCDAVALVSMRTAPSAPWRRCSSSSPPCTRSSCDSAPCALSSPA